MICLSYSLGFWILNLTCFLERWISSSSLHQFSYLAFGNSHGLLGPSPLHPHVGLPFEMKLFEDLPDTASRSFSETFPVWSFLQKIQLALFLKLRFNPLCMSYLRPGKLGVAYRASKKSGWISIRSSFDSAESRLLDTLASSINFFYSSFLSVPNIPTWTSV